MDGNGYRDRAEAGQRLADALERELPDPGDALVLALPRGGVPVADEVARSMALPLDVMVVRKLGLPAQPELAMGALASGGVRVLNQEVLALARVSQETIRAVERRERDELERRERAYRGDRSRPSLRGRTVILVDDGVATGSTLLAAIRAARSAGARRIVAAVPLSSSEAAAKLRQEADLVVCPLVLDLFTAIGALYESFPQLDDDEVRATLERAWHRENKGERRGS